MRARHAAALLVLVAGCAGPTPIETFAGGDPRNAREALEAGHRAGPIAARVVGRDQDATRNDRLLLAAAQGVPALRPRFVPRAGEPQLVLGLTDRAFGDPCAPTPADLTRVVSLAFCEAGRPIAAVQAPWTPGDDLERLVERLARTLFPDLYAERYGFGVGPFRVLLGGSVGFGR